MTIPNSSFIPGLIKGIGHLGSYFLSRMEVNRQNRYNTPKEQVKRLREAGLPIAAAEHFNNEQTSLPDTESIGRAGEGLSAYYDTEKTAKEIKVLQEQISYWGSKAGLKNNELRLSRAEIAYLLDSGYIRDGDEVTWFKHREEIKTAQMELHRDLASIDREIRDRTKEDAINTISARLDLLYSQSDILRQMYDNTEKWNLAKNTMIDSFSEGGLSVIEAGLLMIMQSFSAKVGTGGVNFGN